MEPVYIDLGVRVVRGPDWEWGNVDGGEGHVGTVISVQEPLGGGLPVVVQWDCGNRCRCRCGVAGKFDLRVLDSAPTGTQHLHIDCTWCGEQSIRGLLWSCAQCVDYHLCTPCYNADRHSVEHKFNRRDLPSSKTRVRVSPRYHCPRLIARGAFPGAEVTRGHDWRWGDQDGGEGSVGKVLKIEGWEGESGRSVVQVRWRDATPNVYRMSHKGKVDLRCTRAAAGSYYYPSHLPVLGAVTKDDSWMLSAGDSAKVQLDPDLFKIAQEGHGGWEDSMAEFIGRLCVVHAVHDDRTAVVRYSNNRVLLLNIDTLTKVDTYLFRYGQTVRMIDDIAKVYQLQQLGAGWNDDMALSIGQLGQVVHILPNGNVKVIFKGQRWIISPGALVPAPGESPPSYSADDIRIGFDATVEILSLIKASCLGDALGLAVAAGDVKTVKNCLDMDREQVNQKVDGKPLLQTAIVERFVPMIEILMQYNPNVHSENEDGEMPLHVCALSNNAHAARLLVDAGASVNAENGRSSTPIAVAATQGHIDVLRVLLTSPNANLNAQDQEGRTPLHRTVLFHHHAAIRLLLEAGADHTLIDQKQFTVAHEASLLGNLVAAEEITKFHPEVINVKKDNGNTPLHVAAANNHYDIVSLLASHPTTNVNTFNNARLTALHIAVHEGHIQTVERLVGFGVDVNAVAIDGSTPLHLALGKKNMSSPSSNTPFILKLQEEIELTHGKGLLSPNVVVGIFLVVQGADLHIKNQLGVSPVKIVPADVAALVSSYRGKSDSFHGVLKELVRPFRNELTKSINTRHKVHTAPLSSLSRDAHSPTIRTTIQASVGMDRLTQGLDSVHIGGGLKSGSGLSTIKVKNMYMNNIEPEVISLKKPPSVQDILSCQLCEKGADIKLLPCGHVTLCHSCVVSGQGAKRCPDIECRRIIDSHISVCVFCKQEGGLDHFIPCGHTVCTGCKQLLSYCLACQVLTD